MGRAQPLQHLEAIHARHLDVEQHQVGRLAVGQRQAVLAGGGAVHVEALVLENHLERVANRRLVVDHQNPWFHREAGRSGLVDADGAQRALVLIGQIQVQREHVARAHRGGELLKLARRGDRAAVDLEDHLPAFEVGVKGRPNRIDARDEHAAHVGRQLQARDVLAVEIAHGQAQRRSAAGRD